MMTRMKSNLSRESSVPHCKDLKMRNDKWRRMKQQWDPVRIQCSCWKVVQNITSWYMRQLRLSFDVVSYRLSWAKLGLWRIQNSDKFRFIWRNTSNSIENEDMAHWEILQTMTALESASSLSLLPSLSLLSLAMAEIVIKRESYLKHISFN